MSVLLGLPPSSAMRSPPTNAHADHKSFKQRGEKPAGALRSKSPRLLHRALGGRIARAGSASSVPRSVRNQQILWETVTGRAWEADLPEPSLQEVQSLQYIAPQSLAASPVQSAAPSSPAISLDAISAVLTPVVPAIETVDTQALLSSMEFMVPSQYNHFGSYSSSYTSSYMDPYSASASDDARRRVSSPHIAYASTYATTTEESPLHSPKVETGEQENTPVYQYHQAPRAQYGSSTTDPNAYAYAQPHPSAQVGYSYAAYAPTHDPYANPQYNQGYAPNTGVYLPHPATGYSSSAYASPGSYSVPSVGQSEPVAEDSHGRTKPVCWEHGCNGKQFSTWSNYLRHNREKNGQAAKSRCPQCGAEFTRTTARNGHVKHDKCKRKYAHTATSDP